VNRSVPPDAASYHPYVPPGAVAVRVAVVFTQIVVSDAVGAAGIGLIVMVNVFPMLAQPFPFVTLRVPVYVPAIIPAATGTGIGLAGSSVLPTFTKPAASAAAFQVIV
jgi:hypothetical protein